MTVFFSSAGASVLDYRPSTVAVAAILAATHGAMTKEALESKISSLSTSFLLDKVSTCTTITDHSLVIN
jgi:cyclin D5